MLARAIYANPWNKKTTCNQFFNLRYCSSAEPTNFNFLFFGNLLMCMCVCLCVCVCMIVCVSIYIYDLVCVCVCVEVILSTAFPHPINMFQAKTVDKTTYGEAATTGTPVSTKDS